MSPSLEYRTELSGNLDDKTTLRIASLDFDFLEKVSAWVKDHYPGGELFGGFSREAIRAVEYADSGRYRYVLYCVQNKKGIAAKRALWAEFFDETFHRKDMTPEQEKAKVLEDIKRGIALAQTVERPTSTSMTEHAADVCKAEAEQAPVFDYSVLDDDTAEKLRGITECVMDLYQSYAWGMAYQVGRAHDLLCGKEACKTVLQAHKRNNQYSENTFTAWCTYIGVNRQTAYNMLNAYKLIRNASPEQQKHLQAAPAKLLYEAGKAAAPEELVTAVMDGDITTHKQYQELLAEIRTRDAKISELIEAGEASDRRADTAEKRAREAETQRAAVLDKQGEYITRIHALESRPVEVAVQEPDPAEVERMAEEKARAMTAELRGQLKTAEGNIQRMKSIRDSLQSQLEDWQRAASRQATALTAENVLPMAQDLAGNVKSLYNTFLLAAHGLHGEDYRRCAAPLAQALEEALGGLRANTAQYTANRYEEDEDFE